MEFVGKVKSYVADHRQPKDTQREKYWIKTFEIEGLESKSHNGYVYTETLLVEFLFEDAKGIDEDCTKVGVEVVVEFAPSCREYNGKKYCKNSGHSIKLLHPVEKPMQPPVPIEKEVVGETEPATEDLPF